MANDFLSTYAPLANDIATRTGVDPSVVLGIIDTETGGGQHVAGSNIFGISPSGPQGQYVARYPDVQTASEAFISLMQTPRYRGVAAAGDPASQAAALVRGGYNTVNPQYASIVANKALNIGKQLGYQDKSGGGTEEGPAVYSTSSQPAATADQPAPDDSFVPATAPAQQPAQQPVQPPATTGSAKDRVLSDPALGGNATSAAPASGGTAKDRVLADPALAAPATTTTTTQETAPAQDPYSGAPTSDDYQPSPAVAGAFSRIGQAVAEGSAEGPHLPRVPGDMVMSGIYNPLIAGAETALRGVSALGRGGMQAIYEAGEPLGRALPEVSIPNITLPGDSSITYPGGITIDRPGRGFGGVVAGGPGLGRDLNLLAQVAPVAQAEGGMMRSAMQPPVAPEVNALRPAFVSERMAPPRSPGMTDAERIQQLVEHAVNEEQPSVGPPMARGPATQEVPPTGGGGGVGGSSLPVGAQVTPGYEAIHTPEEEAAYRATAEGKKLLEPQIIGERDLNQYIPGETVNNAEREQTAKAARELKELGIRVPEASDLDKEAAQSNNTARTIYAENTAKGPVEIANRNTKRQADIEADKKTVFAPDNVTGPVNHAPIVDKIQEVLNKPENRQNDAVQAVLRPLIDRLQEEGGAGKISDPREMWGLRQQIDRWTSKRMQSDDNNLHYAAHELGEVSSVMDQQIEKAAPGYDAMIAKYAEHSRAIDEMTVLQGALKNLRGPGQTMTYNDFQRFMKNVVDSRMTPSTDLNAFKAISPENMQRLWNIRDSLRRTASAKELARAAGSDTMPNIIDALKAVGKMGGSAALHAYAFAHLGPGGNFALQSLGNIGKALNERRTIRRTMTQMQNLLRPSESLRVPPGQENALTGAPPP